MVEISVIIVKFSLTFEVLKSFVAIFSDTYSDIVGYKGKSASSNDSFKTLYKCKSSSNGIVLAYYSFNLLFFTKASSKTSILPLPFYVCFGFFTALYFIKAYYYNVNSLFISSSFIL